MRGFGIVAFCLSVLAFAGVTTTGLLAPAVFAQAGTPTAAAAPTAPPAATQAPAVVEVAATATATAPAEAVVESTAAAQPAAPATTDVVTLVAWYSNAADNAFLNVVPLDIKDGVAGPAANGKAIGKADFPEDGLPTITWGDTIFNAYLRFEGDVAERWTWFDDSEGARPATLVIQVEGTGGKYQGYFGSATFISRDDGAGGTLVLAIRPPRPAAATPAA
ncbi:MAG TPA: hypothetical protein VFQ80_05645 [Thermomicrobiales bacterium]|nr:hypothetical protein [Thermomicrobiales bacterium]